MSRKPSYEELEHKLRQLEAQVTDLKNMGQSLNIAKERYELALGFTKEGIWDWNPRTNEVYFSPGWKRMLGYDDAEIRNEISEWKRLTEPEDAQSAYAMIEEVMAGTSDQLEKVVRMRHKDGRWLSILARAKVLRDDEGRAVRMVGTHVDISPQIENEQQLQEALARLKLAMESANEGPWEADYQVGLAYYAPRTLTSLGFGSDFPPQKLGWWRNRVHPDEQAEVENAYKDLLSGKTPSFQAEFRFAHLDGHYIWFSSHAQVIRRDKDGSPLLVAGIHRNIDERKRAEQELRRTQELYRLVTRNIHDVIMLTDENLQPVYFSRSIKDMLGYSPEEILKLAPKDYVAPESWPEIRRLTINRLEAERHNRGDDENQSFTMKYITRTGRRVSIEQVTSPMRDKTGRFRGLLVVSRDITQRLEAEKALKENQRRFETLLSNLPGMAYRCTAAPDWTIELVSEGCLALTGHRPEDLIGEPITAYSKLIHPEDRAPVWEAIQQGLKNHQPVGLTYRIIAKDGREKWVWDQNWGVFNGRSELLALEGFISDITEQTETLAALEDSEAKYRFITENMADIVWMLDTEFKHIYVSPSVERILGFTPEERSAMTPEEMLTPDSVKLAFEALAREIQNDSQGADPERSRAYELEYYHKDGSIVWMENIVKAIRNKDGELVGIHGVSRDISERKRAVKRIEGLNQLRKNLLAPAGLEEKMTRVTEAVVDILDADFARVWLIREGDRCRSGCGQPCPGQDKCLHLVASSGRHTNLDGSHARVPLGECGIGRVAAAVEPGFLTNRVTEDSRVQDAAWAQELGYKSFAGYKLVAVDGMTTGVLALFSRREFSPEDEHMLQTIAGTASVVIQVDRSVEALRRSHEMFLTVLDGLDATIYVADMETYRILFMNRFMKEAFGRDLTGEICYQVFRQEGAPCGHCTNSRLLDDNGRPTGVSVWEGENPVTGQWYINYDRAIKWLDGHYVRLQVATDITKLKQLEDQLRQTHKMEAMGTLAGGIAHDFNNILAAIIGYTEISLDDLPESAPVHHNMHQVLRSAHRAKELVKQILSFSRRDEHRIRPIRMEAIAAETLDLLRATLPTTIEMGREFEPGLAVVEADPTQIHQLILNLCGNAADAMKQTGGRLTVRLENTEVDRALAEKSLDLKKGRYVKLTVADTGPGIPPDLVDRVFDPFFTTKEVGAGTGMGLSVVHGIVQSHGGAVVVDSRPGRGCTFEVYLPASSKDPDRPEDRQTTGPPQGSGRVLFVDDEPLLAQFAEQMLTKLGYEPAVFTSSRKALAAVQAEPDGFDLVITDMTMPGLTGVELAAEILKLRPEMPIILCTGYSDQIDEAQACRLGIRRLEIKPLTVSDTGRIISEILNG